MAHNPRDLGLRMTLSSAVRMAERTERELYDAAISAQVDMCRYRLVKHIGEGFGLQSIARSLELFQEAISHVYDAITGQPKTRARITPEKMRESQLLFGYSYAGSLGVILLAPSERGMFFSKFDDVVKTINEIFDIQDNFELRDAAKAIGPAAIRKIYEWAEVNHDAGYDLDLRWTNSSSVEIGRYVEAKSFGRIANLISLTSDVETNRFRTQGVLVGFNSVFKTFHFVEPEGGSYKGPLADDFPLRQEWTVNKPYEAAIWEEITTRFSTGEQTRKYRLSELKPLDEGSGGTESRPSMLDGGA
jgi:hypothetical protein